jgi:hypothetical protein
MDRFLIDYIQSGNACVLIGSGPSTQMGYPSWATLANAARTVCAREVAGADLSVIDDAITRNEFPKVFDLAKHMLGSPRLLQHLQSCMVPVRAGKLYDLLARWPVPVYLTTNYDDEINNALVRLQTAYQPAPSNRKCH